MQMVATTPIPIRFILPLILTLLPFNAAIGGEGVLQSEIYGNILAPASNGICSQRMKAADKI